MFFIKNGRRAIRRRNGAVTEIDVTLARSTRLRAAR
jgi:hypothetical protein